MNHAALTPAEQQTLVQLMREGEQMLWAGRGMAASVPPPGLLARLLGKAPAGAAGCLYAITNKRVLALPEQGSEPQEWFLMLGLVREVRENAGGCGDIVFDYEEAAGRKEARGILGVEAVSQVRNLLQDAIDAAYAASPWSV